MVVPGSVIVSPGIVMVVTVGGLVTVEVTVMVVDMEHDAGHVLVLTPHLPRMLAVADAERARTAASNWSWEGMMKNITEFMFVGI